MGAFCIVPVTPALREDGGFGHRRERLGVQALVVTLAIETLAEAILPGAARVDGQRLSILAGRPGLRPGDELRPVVTAEVLQLAVPGEQAFQYRLD